jgi:predicted transcriptional regulator
LTIWDTIPDIYTDLKNIAEQGRLWLQSIKADLLEQQNIILARVAMEGRTAIEKIKIKAAALGAPTGFISACNTGISTIDTWLETKLGYTSAQLREEFDKLDGITKLVEEVRDLLRNFWSRLK